MGKNKTRVQIEGRNFELKRKISKMQYAWKTKISEVKIDHEESEG